MADIKHSRLRMKIEPGIEVPTKKQKLSSKEQRFPRKVKEIMRTYPIRSRKANVRKKEVDIYQNDLQLNDEFLLKMFEYLDLKELCAIADVSQYFRILAQNAFRQKFEKLKIFGLDRLLFRRTLRKFGHLITSLDIQKTILAAADIMTIAKYCTNLERLTLAMLKVDCKSFQSVFIRLKYLRLDGCDFMGNRHELFSTCTKLNVLSIDVNKYYDMPKCHFPNLYLLQFDCSVAWKSYYLWQLLQSNPQIKSLLIWTLPDDEIVANVVQNAPNIDTLHIGPGIIWKTSNGQSQNGLMKLANLKSLKDLSLATKCGEDYDELVGPLVDTLAKKKVSIEHLSMESFKITRSDLQSIFRLKALQTLMLDSVQEINDNDLILIAKHLPHLQQIHLNLKFIESAVISFDGMRKMMPFAKQLTHIRLDGVRNMKIDKNAFEKLQKVVMNRSGGILKVAISGCCSSTGFDVPKHILTYARNTLRIEYKSDGNSACECDRCKKNEINMIETAQKNRIYSYCL